MGQQGGINAPYTRFRGPVLVGQSSDFGIAAVNGGSTAPLISFWNASEHGFYVASSAEVRFAAAGHVMAITSGAVRVGTTDIYTAAGGKPYLVIPRTTGIMSSGTLPLSADLQGGAAFVWAASSASDNLGKLWVYTTASTGWMASTTPFYTTTAT